MKEYLAISLLALGLATPVMAVGPVIYANGSTATRTDVYYTLCHELSGTVGFTVAGTHSSAQFTFTGTWPLDGSALAGQFVTIYYSGNGSASGMQHVVAGDNVAFLPVGGGATFNHAATLAFSDVFQDSTSVLAPLNEEQIGVITFVFAGNAVAAADGIVNVTAQNCGQVYATGTGSLDEFTGNSAQSGIPVYGSGRNDGSGTRITTLAETGYGINTTINQYYNGVRTGTFGSYSRGANQSTWTSFGLGQDNDGDGWTSGGSVNGDLINPLITTPGIAYIGYSDAVSPAGATIFKYNGYALTAGNVQSGNYTLWGYEHMYVAADPDATAFWNAFPSVFDAMISSGIMNYAGCDGGSYTPGTSCLPRSQMHVLRFDDGAPVLHL